MSAAAPQLALWCADTTPADFDPFALEAAEDSRKKGDQFRDAIEAQLATFTGVSTVLEVALCDAPSMYAGWLKHDVALHVPALTRIGVPSWPIAANLGTAAGRATPAQQHVNVLIEAKFMQNRGTVERSNQESVERLIKLSYLTGIPALLVTHFSDKAVSKTARLQLQATCEVAAVPLLTFDDLRDEDAFLNRLTGAATAQLELAAAARAHLDANTLPPRSDRQLRQYVALAEEAEYAAEETRIDAALTLCE